MANVKLVGSHVGVSIGERRPFADGPGRYRDHAHSCRQRCVVSQRRGLHRKTGRADGHAQRHLFPPNLPPQSAGHYKNEELLSIGGAKVVRQSAGDKVTVVAAGVTLFEALKAAEALKSEGIGITVIDAYSVKPLAKEVIKTAAQKTNNLVITVEDHIRKAAWATRWRANSAPRASKFTVSGL